MTMHSFFRKTPIWSGVVALVLVMAGLYFTYAWKRPVPFDSAQAEAGPVSSIIFSTVPLEVGLPIASITKLMTALVVVEKYPELLTRAIPVSASAAATPGDHAKLPKGERITGYELIKAMLIGSSNDAATLLAEQVGTDKFVENMNDVAGVLGMKSTHFINPTGLDQGMTNISSPQDLSILLHYFYKNEPDILAVTRMSSASIRNGAGGELFTVKNTDELLADPLYGPRIIGGKTGETPLAKQNLVLLAENKASSGAPVVFVILGSEDRVGEMKRLLEGYYGQK